jgi:uncharacterized protein YggE
MKKILVLLVAVLFAVSLQAQYGQQQKEHIQVQGYHEIEVTPDELYFRIIIDEEDYKGKKKIVKLEEKLIQGLTNMNVSKEDLSVKSFDSDLDQNWFRDDDIYEKRTYELLLHDTKTANELFKLCKELEISNVYLMSYDISNREELLKDVKKEALRKAKSEAEFLLESIGEKLGNAIWVNVQRDYNYGKAMLFDSEFSVRGARAGNPVEVPEPHIPEITKIKLTANITAAFEIVHP